MLPRHHPCWLGLNREQGKGDRGTSHRAGCPSAPPPHPAWPCTHAHVALEEVEKAVGFEILFMCVTPGKKIKSIYEMMPGDVPGEALDEFKRLQGSRGEQSESDD